MKDSNLLFLKNPATEEDAHHSTRDPSEEVFSLVNWVFDAHSLGEFIDAVALIHYGPASRAAREAGEMCLYLMELSSKMKRLKERVRYNTSSAEKRLRDLLA